MSEEQMPEGFKEWLDQEWPIIGEIPEATLTDKECNALCRMAASQALKKFAKSQLSDEQWQLAISCVTDLRDQYLESYSKYEGYLERQKRYQHSIDEMTALLEAMEVSGEG